MLEVFTLKFKDIPLGILTYNKPEDTFSFEVTCSEEDKHYLPRLFRVRGVMTDEDLKYWIADRVVPPDRVNIGQILTALGIAKYDPWEICKANRGYFSTDSYWLEDPKHPQKWTRFGQ